MSEGQRHAFRSLPPSERHRRLIARRDVAEQRAKEPTAALSKPEDVGFFSLKEEESIRQQHRFIRSDGDEGAASTDRWATRLAKKYYERLFKEYCIVDLSLYEYGCLGTRWRTEGEVKKGKGQFVCASTKCMCTESLGTYEINFSYSEDGVKKQALVKVRLCPDCVLKMNYRRAVLKEKVDASLRKANNKRRNDHSMDKHRRTKKKRNARKPSDPHLKDVSERKHIQDEESDDSEGCLDDLFL